MSRQANHGRGHDGDSFFGCVAGAVENFSRPRARVLAVVDPNLAVHDDEIDSIGCYIRKLRRRAVLDFAVVEDDSECFQLRGGFGSRRLNDTPP